MIRKVASILGVNFTLFIYLVSIYLVQQYTRKEKKKKRTEREIFATSLSGRNTAYHRKH